jgi:hypothetical protein
MQSMVIDLCAEGANNATALSVNTRNQPLDDGIDTGRNQDEVEGGGCGRRWQGRME